jgi:putative ABC transport system substrate-binding protein
MKGGLFFHKQRVILFTLLLVFGVFNLSHELTAQEVKKKFKIGLAVLKDNPDYSNSRMGFISFLEKQKDIEVEFLTLDAAGDLEAYKRGLEKMAKVDKVDLIFTTGTRSTQPAVEMIKDIPIIFSAVADPVAAGIVKSLESPGGNVTGAHCAVPVEAQLKTILRVIPYVKRIGIVYTQGEVNAEIQMRDFKKTAQSLGIEVLTSTVSVDCKTEEEVREATKKLVGKVDLLLALQDTSLSRYGIGMLEVAEENKIPTYVTLEQLLEKGAVFSLGINFSNLGKICGEQAVKILRDNIKPSDIPVATDRNYSLVINLTAAKKIGLAIPIQILRSASKVVR